MCWRRVLTRAPAVSRGDPRASTAAQARRRSRGRGGVRPGEGLVEVRAKRSVIVGQGARDDAEGQARAVGAGTLSREETRVREARARCRTVPEAAIAAPVAPLGVHAKDEVGALL